MPRRRGAKSSHQSNQQQPSPHVSISADQQQQQQQQQQQAIEIIIGVDGSLTSNRPVMTHQQVNFGAVASASASSHDNSSSTEPFLVCCVVNGVNNIRTMVDPNKDSEVSWDVMREVSSSSGVGDTSSSSSIDTLPAAPGIFKMHHRQGAPLSEQSNSSTRSGGGSSSNAPKSRLTYDPARYTNIAATSPLEPVHPALAELAPRFNRKFELCCLLTAPTMVAAAGQQAAGKKTKHYAALLRLVFDKDPHVPVPEDEYRRQERQLSEGSENHYDDEDCRSDKTEAQPLQQQQRENDTDSDAEFSSSKSNSSVAAAAAAAAAAASSTVTLQQQEAGSISAPSSLASSSGDTTPAALLLLPPNRSYQVPASAAFLNSQQQQQQQQHDSTAGSFGGTTTVNIRGAQPPRHGQEAADSDREFEIYHRLGPVQFLPPVESALFVHRLPKSAQLMIAEVPDPELEAAEVILARSVRDILESDEYEGSHPSSHIQNFAQYMPGYDIVVGTGAAGAGAAAAGAAVAASSGGGASGIRGSWNNFVDYHTGHEWCLFRYTQQMIDGMDLGPATSGAGIKAGEPRMVAWAHLDRFMEADMAREQLRRGCEAQVREAVLSAVRKEPLSQNDVMKLLAKNRSFLSIMSPQLVKMLNLIAQDPRYVVLRHRLHPITVEKNRDVAETVAQQQQQQQQRRREQSSVAAEASKD